MKRKVAIIDPLGAHGSSHHFYLYGQLDGLRNNKVDVRIYTNKKTEDPCIRGVRFYQTYGDLFSNDLKIISGIKYVLGSIKSMVLARISGVSLFHFHIFYTNVLVLFNLLLVKFLFGKVVFTIHDVASFSSKNQFLFLSKLVYKMTDLILTHNRFSKSEIIKIDPILKHKIHIIPHGNYTSYINVYKDKNKSREYLSLPKDKTILLFFGLIKDVKGLDVLLKSFKKVIDENPDTILLVAGKPWKNDFSVYQKIIDDYNLRDNIILHTRFIFHNDLDHYYCASDLVVLPYKKIYQSGVLMMALSYKRAVLTSDLPPLKEIITDNENGFLFKSEDVDDLSARINLILSDKMKLEKVQKNAGRLINEKFGWNEIGRLTKTAYQTL